MTQKINIAILGASGYTGVELIRFLLQHPHANIAALSGDSQAGKPIAEVFPHLTSITLPPLQKMEEIDASNIDLVFCCLPHATTQVVIHNLLTALPKIKVIDLSADFRLRDPATYEQWYGHPHQATALQTEAIYGLTELARNAIRSARLVANPGCYPTSAQLPLIPLLKSKLIQADDIIIDAKSGVTGAGRKASQNLLYSEINEGFSAYGVGTHRHTPEIEQGLSDAAGKPLQIRFTPHLVPMNRGILSTLYVTLAPHKTIDDLREALQTQYANEPFVTLLPAGIFPSTAMVRGSNACVMNVFADRITGKAILVCAIDNLVKGASGQAVQNMNLMFGWAETVGLPQVAVFP
jgi:N-acetyl-gamma-glutamyl-phosphate reductase